MTDDDSGLNSMQAMAALLDMRSPQTTFRDMIEAGGFIQAMPEMALCFDRESVDHVLRHHDQFSSIVEMNLGNVRPLIPLNVDPPNHSKYRKLLDPLFAPRRMDEQEEDITRRVNGFIDSFIDAGECNFTEEFADPFPSSVFLGLLGLPETDLRLFLDLRDGILHPEKRDPGALFDVDLRLAVQKATGAEIYDYFGALIDERTARPTDDVMSRFLAAEVDGDRLSREDILDISFLFLIAGLDTVSDTLTCMYAFLAQHPDHRRMLVDDPSLTSGAVEEMLRWESPVPFSVPRIATEDVVLPNGGTVKKGTGITCLYGAANVDATECPMPFDVDFARETNRHVAFGGGVHRCLGSHLARRELRITLQEWHRRIPDYWLKPGHEELDYPPGLRHVKDLTLAWR